MTDIDTSRNTFDPRPNLADLIAAHEAAERSRPVGARITVIRAVVMDASNWGFTVRKRLAHYRANPTGRNTHIRRVFTLIDTADRLGLPIGRVVGEVTCDV